jgi:hypothetical protein
MNQSSTLYVGLDVHKDSTEMSHGAPPAMWAVHRRAGLSGSVRVSEDDVLECLGHPAVLALGEVGCRAQEDRGFATHVLYVLPHSSLRWDSERFRGLRDGVGGCD